MNDTIEKYNAPIAELGQVMEYRHPSLKKGVDYLVQDDSDGRGPYLKEWNNSEPKPTESEILASREQMQLDMILKDQEEETEQSNLLKKLNLTEADFKLLKKMIRGD